MQLMKAVRISRQAAAIGKNPIEYFLKNDFIELVLLLFDDDRQSQHSNERNGAYRDGGDIAGSPRGDSAFDVGVDIDAVHIVAVGKNV